MEKNGKRELDLSEEQLQAITGGCGQCGPLQAQLTQARGLRDDHAAQYLTTAAQVRQTPVRSPEYTPLATQALDHFTKNHQSADQVRSLQSSIDALHLAVR
jgi:hypothetical protein